MFVPGILGIGITSSSERWMWTFGVFDLLPLDKSVRINVWIVGIEHFDI
jgi:hypothetical protein